MNGSNDFVKLVMGLTTLDNTFSTISRPARSLAKDNYVCEEKMRPRTKKKIGKKEYINRWS